MTEENILRPIGTKFKIVSEPILHSNEIRKRCNEWEVINHTRAFMGKDDKIGTLLEEIKMVSSKVINENSRIRMTDLNEIWKSVDVGTNIKTLWFDTPEEATDYLKRLLNNISTDMLIANEDDEEIDKDELLYLFDEYCLSQEDILSFRLVEDLNDYLVITIECWDSHSDYDFCADVVTISKYCNDSFASEVIDD